MQAEVERCTVHTASPSVIHFAGCGANCAFLTLPARLAARPVLTGWLADPSILAPDSPATLPLGGQARHRRASTKG